MRPAHVFAAVLFGCFVMTSACANVPLFVDHVGDGGSDTGVAGGGGGFGGGGFGGGGFGGGGFGGGGGFAGGVFGGFGGGGFGGDGGFGGGGFGGDGGFGGGGVGGGGGGPCWPLSGAGVPRLSITPTEVTFPVVAPGQQSAPAGFTVTNTGCPSIDAFTIDNPEPTAFMVVATSCPSYLNQGQTCTIDVVATDSSAGWEVNLTLETHGVPLAAARLLGAR